MELKPGYKQTEVGAIPKDWRAEPLGPFVQICSGESPSGFRFEGSGIPYFKVDQLNLSEKYLSGSAYYFRSGRTVPRGSVIFPKRGASILLNKVRILANDSFMDTNLMTLTPSSSIESEYLYYALTHVGLWRVADTTSIPQINNKHIRPLVIPLPPVPEQRAIAAALSDVDALIGALDRLIAKKRDLKQAAMQQLLTGQTRLPGFTAKWSESTIGDLGSWFSGGTPSMTNEGLWSGDIPWVSPKDMKTSRLYGAIDHVSERALGAGTRLLPTGAILIVVRGMILAHSLPVARLEHPMAFNQDIKGLVVSSSNDSDFVLWWLTAHKSLLLSKTTESTHGTKRLPTEELFEVKVALPAVEEQTAIADVLSDMDAEITALEARRDKTRLLKQGMMQELLTGKTRLV